MDTVGATPALVPPSDGCPPMYRPRNPRASPLFQLFETYYETVKAVWEERFERQYGFWQGRWDRAVAAYIGLRHRSVPGLQGRVPRRFFVSVSGALSLVQRQARSSPSCSSTGFSRT